MLREMLRKKHVPHVPYGDPPANREKAVGFEVVSSAECSLEAPGHTEFFSAFLKALCIVRINVGVPNV